MGLGTRAFPAPRVRSSEPAPASFVGFAAAIWGRHYPKQGLGNQTLLGLQIGFLYSVEALRSFIFLHVGRQGVLFVCFLNVQREEITWLFRFWRSPEPTAGTPTAAGREGARRKRAQGKCPQLPCRPLCAPLGPSESKGSVADFQYRGPCLRPQSLCLAF